MKPLYFDEQISSILQKLSKNLECWETNLSIDSKYSKIDSEVFDNFRIVNSFYTEFNFDKNNIFIIIFELYRSFNKEVEYKICLDDQPTFYHPKTYISVSLSERIDLKKYFKEIKAQKLLKAQQYNNQKTLNLLSKIDGILK